MRVLLLPQNIASQISLAVRALNEIGVDATGLASRGVITSNEDIRELPLPEAGRRRGWSRAMRYAAKTAIVLQSIHRADVVHWHYEPALRGGADVAAASIAGKSRLIEFHGSDIRIPELEARDNPYYAQVMAQHECRMSESITNSRRRQEAFARRGVSVVVPCRSLLPYIQRDLFPQVYFVRHLLDVSRYVPRYPERMNCRPVIMHSPSAPIIKGTAAVVNAVDTLSHREIFSFRLLQGMPHSEALRLVSSCDIFVDQLVLGAHGVAALEAMAYGKPVVCYIKPQMVKEYPPDLPIVKATKESLPNVLRSLIRDGELRRRLGQEGRAYVERYHDSHALARQLVSVYEHLSRH